MSELHSWLSEQTNAQDMRPHRVQFFTSATSASCECPLGRKATVARLAAVSTWSRRTRRRRPPHCCSHVGGFGYAAIHGASNSDCDEERTFVLSVGPGKALR
jgi:hypothetical protein